MRYLASSLGVEGLYFFEEDGVTVTVTSDRFFGMLQNFFQLQLRQFDENDLEDTTRRLQQMFPGHFTSLRGDIGSPSRFIGLKLSQQLKDAVKEETAAIPQDMLERGMEHFHETLQQLVAHDRHLHNIILKIFQKYL